MFDVPATLSALILLAVHIIVVVVATIYVSANRRPSAAIAWVLTIIFIPYIGALVYFTIGASRRPKARRQKQIEVNSWVLARVRGLELVSHRDRWPVWLESAVRLNQNLGALPMVGGNRATLLPEYEATLAAMVAEIDTVTDFVNVEFFIAVKDETTKEFFAALGRASARGGEDQGAV